MDRESKKNTVKNLKENFKDSEGVVVTHYLGLNNSELTDNNPESSGLLEIDGNNQKLDNLKSNKTDINKSQIFGEDSLIQRFLNKGIDGVTTNPNYKLLALLIILLINLYSSTSTNKYLTICYIIQS